MSQPRPRNDTQRDALKFQSLVRALSKARQEVKLLESGGNVDLVGMLARLLPEIAKALDAEHAFVAEQKGSGADERLWLQIVWAYPQQELNGHHLEQMSIFEQLLRSGQSRVIAPLEDSPQALVLGLEVFNATSAILVRAQTAEVTYVVGLCNKKEQEQSGPFLAADRTMIESLLELIGAGVRIGERLTKETTRLLDVQKATQKISEAAQGNAANLPRTIARTIINNTHADYVAVTAPNRSQTQLVSVGAWLRQNSIGTRGQWHATIDRSNLDGYVTATKRHRYVPNVDDASLSFAISGPPSSRLRSIYCVPLLSQGKIIGTLHVASQRVDGIRREEREFIQRLAPHAAIALYNAQLLRETREQQSIRDRVIAVQHAIADILDWNEQARQIRESLSTYYDIGGFFLADYDAKSGRIELTKVYDHSRKVEDHEKTSDSAFGPRRLGERIGLIDLVIQQNQAIVIDDFTTSELTAQIAPIYRQGIKSCIAVPMRLGNRITGVLGLRNYDRTHAYSEYDRYFLETLASDVAIVMDNSRKYSQRVKELRAVSKFQRQISSVDVTTRDVTSALHSTERVVEKEIQNIYKETHETLAGIDMPIEDMCIALYDHTRQELRFPVVYERSSQLDEARKAIDPIYRTRKLGERNDIYDWFCRTRHSEPVLLNSQQSMQDWMQMELSGEREPMRAQSWLGAPMVFLGDFIGVIALRHFDEENAFDERHKELLQTIARQAAIAIDNARLYDDLRDSAQKLTRTNTIAAMGAWAAESMHSVNTNAGAIRRSVHILLNKAGLPEDVVTRLKTIEQAATALEQSELWEPLPENGHTKVRNPPLLDELVHAEVDAHGRSNPRVQFASDLHCPNQRVAISPIWLRSILGHLIKNGLLHLNADVHAPLISVATQFDGAWVKLSVADNGTGVREEIRELLFRQPIDHDQSTRPVGMGRGLLLVRYIAEAYGGAAWLEWTEIGQGSRFVVLLPVAEARQ